METKIVEEFIRESNAIESLVDDLHYQLSLDGWNHAYAQFKQAIKFEYTKEYLLEIHQRVMMDHPEIAGRYRTGWVSVSGRSCPSPELIPGLVERWLILMNESAPTAGRLEEYTKDLHIEFERVHPFADGNGRTGRILFNIHRLDLGLPMMVIRAETKAEDYYPWFS